MMQDAHAVSVSLVHLRSDLQLSRERLARVLDVSAKTIERWEAKGEAPVGGSLHDRLIRLREIVDLGRTVYSEAGFTCFLNTPLREFDGRTALQLIQIGEADRVLAALVADYEGLGH